MRQWGLPLFLLASLACCSRPPELAVQDAWTRDTVGRTSNAAVFMTIRSENSDRLVAASTPIARKTDLMTMGVRGSAMGMKYVPGIDIPSSTAVSLNPSGLHVWLEGLEHPLRAGETFPLTLKFQKAGERRIVVSVLEPASAPPVSQAH